MIILTEFKLNFIESIIYINTTFKNVFLIKVYFNSLSFREQLSIYIQNINKQTDIYIELNKKNESCSYIRTLILPIVLRSVPFCSGFVATPFFTL